MAKNFNLSKKEEILFGGEVVNHLTVAYEECDTINSLIPLQRIN